MNTAPSSVAGEIADFDVARYRADFPILSRTVHDKPLVFLDSAASAQKPQVVIDAVSHCYEAEYANIHRGVHWLSERATAGYEGARTKIAKFLNAASDTEIVFTKNATEAINLVASSWGGTFLQAGDEVIITVLEHHANIVPWHLLRERTGIVIKAVPVDDSGALDMAAYHQLLGPRTKLVSVTHASNALGSIPPVEQMIRDAHAVGARVLIDGCQAIVHSPVDVQALDADFYVFSGHKLYGPTGIGVLYGKAGLLADMPPYQGGGDMIRTVTLEESTFADPPSRFEAGTPHIAGAIGLSAAVDYVSAIGMERIAAHEADLLAYATERLGDINSLRIYGTAPRKASILSFDLAGAHPHDVGTILDREGVAVRVGHHCAQPVMERFGISGTVRASFGLYNTRADVDALYESIGQVMEIFG